MNGSLKPGEFLGNANSIRMADAVLSEVVHESVRSIPVHRHEWPYVSMLLRGFYAETVGDTTMHCQPFSAVFHGAAMTHSDEIGEGGARFFIIELGESWAEIIERLGGRRQSFFELHGEGTSWPALRAYHAFIEGAQGEADIDDALFEICGHLPKAPLPDASEPPWLSAAQAILVRDYFKPYSLRALADEVHVDPSHLARTFYRFKGCTAGDFVNRVRVQAACRRLGELGDPLEAIAKSTGFSDQSHMTRAIRRLCGNTPALLRRALTRVGEVS